MIKIHKGREPKTLEEYRTKLSKKDLKNKTVYEDFDHKTREGCESEEAGNLRRALLEEQGHVCCYCLTRIDCKRSEIEHFKPQSKYRDLQIDYKNLFLSCLGGSKKDFHCDQKKGDKELSSVDLLSNIEGHVSYKKTGEIVSSDPSLDNDINEILNLNSYILIKNRRQTYSNLITQMTKEKSENWTKTYIQKILKKYEQKNSKGQYSQYYGMLVHFLRNKL